MGRVEDLEQHIHESYQLIREYEEILRLSSDPKEKARAQRAIIEQRELIRKWAEEYQQISSNPLPDHLVELARPAPEAPTVTHPVPKKPGDEPQRPIQGLGYFFVALLAIDLIIALMLGWRFFGHQPELLSYLEVITGFLGIALEILLLGIVIQRQMSVEDIVFWLGTNRILQAIITIATLALLLIFLWPQVSQISNQAIITSQPTIAQEAELKSTSPLTTTISVTSTPTQWLGPCRIEAFEAQPPSPQPVGSLVIFEVRGTCDSGVRAIRLLINDEWYGEKGGHISPPEEFVPTWPTKDLSPGDYKITAEAATWGDDEWTYAARQVLTFTLVVSSTSGDSP